MMARAAENRPCELSMCEHGAGVRLCTRGVCVCVCVCVSTKASVPGSPVAPVCVSPTVEGGSCTHLTGSGAGPASPHSVSCCEPPC
ncbi:unnamed protein product [Caretta caretta]